MDDDTISSDERWFLGTTFQERLDDDYIKLLRMLDQFRVDIHNHGIVRALNRVSDRLCPSEAMLLALTALSNAAYGAKCDVHVIRDEHKADLSAYVATILGTSPLQEETPRSSDCGGSTSSGA